MMMGIWFIFFILIITGFVILIFWAVKRKDFIPVKEKVAGNNLAILKERYVRGEITKNEFEMIKKDLI